MTRFMRLSGGMLAVALILSSPAFAETTLWLVRPLYPGQEALVERTEKALDKLISSADREDHVIGRTELAAALKGKKVEESPASARPSGAPTRSIPSWRRSASGA